MSLNLSRSRAICMFAICVSLLSCASQKPPFKVAVTAAAGYRGPLHVRLCQPGAAMNAQLDASGNGVTSACPEPGDNMEIHGTRGSAIITGDQLTAWDVEGDSDAPVESAVMSGASDPMAISTRSFERQFQDFAAAIRDGRPPLVSGEEGYRAVELVDAIYRSAREARRVSID